MATPNRPVVFRFVFGKGVVKARRESADTSRAVAKNIALRYSEDNWDAMKTALIEQITRDVRDELDHLSSMFRRFITGAPGSKTTPNGTLTTVAKGGGEPSARLSSLMPEWKQRTKRYMDEKRRRTGSIEWFRNRQWRSMPDNRFVGSKVMSRGKYGGKEPGYLHTAFAPGGARSIWEEMFGPVSVRIQRSHRGDMQAEFGGNNHVKVEMANIQVRALGKIDLAMLAGTAPALSRFVWAKDPEMGKRLGRMNNGTYRPTMEPFISFFLTRALPHAVDTRIRKGMAGLISRRKASS